MAKKKKQIQEENKTTDSISYQGTVKVSIQNGKRTISSKTYRNTGCPKLFEFICNALGGNYVEGSRPCKIVLYGLVDNRTDTPTNPDLTKDRLISPAVTEDTASYLSYNTTDKTWSITHHFRIPYNFITSNSIYKAALVSSSFDKEYLQYENELYAYYLFKTNDTTWNPLRLTTTAGNFSLVIEWTMTISNK